MTSRNATFSIGKKIPENFMVYTHLTDFCLLGLGLDARLPRLDVVAVDSSESRDLSSRDFVDPGESRDSSATSERSSVI